MTLLLAAHGSRDPRFAHTAGRIADRVADRLPDADVRLAYLDLNTPTVADALGTLTGAVTVVPLLLSDAFHARVDLPGIISAARQRNPGLDVTQTAPLGADPRLAFAAADRLRQAELRPGDGILCAAVGSTDLATNAVAYQHARQLGGLLDGHHVRTVFCTDVGRRDEQLQAAVDELRDAGARRFIASPFMIASGLLSDRLERYLDVHTPDYAVAGPLGAHARLTEVIADRYRQGTIASPHRAVSESAG
ncbi:sirohydrochlorin chelatase [Jongsikchunia kroppenstedtii]|uniref:sirohydrochlorin chelatase n=1 Tax=Jongsikchunia kroppenstedtii TaxID=1121721 RepID=UPI00038064C8|nr:sirohydrochlorin chelatase [Jongsikchunia kroppenstedtii]